MVTKLPKEREELIEMQILNCSDDEVKLLRGVVRVYSSQKNWLTNSSTPRSLVALVGKLTYIGLKYSEILAQTVRTAMNPFIWQIVKSESQLSFDQYGPLHFGWFFPQVVFPPCTCSTWFKPKFSRSLWGLSRFRWSVADVKSICDDNFRFLRNEAVWTVKKYVRHFGSTTFFFPQADQH